MRCVALLHLSCVISTRNFEWLTPICTGRAAGEVGTWRDGRGERVLPTRDQHRREIASNLWVRLITRECSSFDSPLFLRPQLHQTSFQRWGESLLLSRHLFHALFLSIVSIHPFLRPFASIYVLELAHSFCDCFHTYELRRFFLRNDLFVFISLYVKEYNVYDMFPIESTHIKLIKSHVDNID